MDEKSYNGAQQYARAKRAQVVLNEMWAARVPRDEIVFHAMHPGWADTPGVDAGIPGFGKVMGPLLRTPEQGADTIVWLAAADERDPVGHALVPALADPVKHQKRSVLGAGHRHHAAGGGVHVDLDRTDPVQLVVEAFPEREFNGRIDRIGVKAGARNDQDPLRVPDRARDEARALLVVVQIEIGLVIHPEVGVPPEAA